MAKDPFSTSVDSMIAPAQTCFAIAPADADELPYVTKTIYVGRSGDVKLLPLRSDTPVTFRNLIGGTVLDVRARMVYLTGTTALDLVGLA